MKLNEKITLCRKKAGWSQEELAARLGLSRQAVSKWECGTAEPDLHNLKAMADVFGMTADWLLSDSADEPISGEADHQTQRESSEQSENAELYENEMPGQPEERTTDTVMNGLKKALYIAVILFAAVIGAVIWLVSRYGYISGPVTSEIGAGALSASAVPASSSAATIGLTLMIAAGLLFIIGFFTAFIRRRK